MVSLVVKFFDDARGSAFECAACLDASVAKGFVSIDRVRPGKEMLARVVAMLTRLNRSLRYKQSHVLIPRHPIVLRSRPVSRWYERDSRRLLPSLFLLSYVHPCNRPQSVTDHDDEDDYKDEED